MNADLIKEKTKAYHKKLDQHPVLKNILRKSVTPIDYLNFLTLHYNALNSLNNIILETCTYFDFQFITKLDLLEREIELVSEFCNVEKSKIMNLNIKSSTIKAPSIGLIYVTEGARHGNFYINKHLKNELELPETAFTYLSAKNSIEWSDVLKIINQSDNHVFNEAIQDAVEVYKLYLSIANKIQSKSFSQEWKI